MQNRQAQNGKAVTSFGIAVAKRYRREGEPDANFFTVNAWGKTAEFAAKFFRKGMRIEVIGELNNRYYKDKDGKKRYVTEIEADELAFGERKQADTAEGTKGSFEELSVNNELPF